MARMRRNSEQTLLKAFESSRRSYDEILAFITSSAEEKS